jgi:hypothetical protein
MGGEPLFSTHPLPPPLPTSQPSASVPAAEETPAQYVATPESVMITFTTHSSTSPPRAHGCRLASATVAVIRLRIWPPPALCIQSVPPHLFFRLAANNRTNRHGASPCEDGLTISVRLPPLVPHLRSRLTLDARSLCCHCRWCHPLDTRFTARTAAAVRGLRPPFRSSTRSRGHQRRRRRSFLWRASCLRLPAGGARNSYLPCRPTSSSGLRPPMSALL